MRMAFSAILVALMASGGPVQASDTAVGTWRMTNGKVTVQVADCGAALCATVVGLRKPRDEDGQIKRDKQNPDPGLRQRPVMGLTILNNMRPAGEGRWSGTIYNPDDGNTYSSRIQLVGHSTLKVSGCVAGVLCKTMKFTRVD